MNMCAQRTAHTPPTDSARLRVWRVQTHTRSSMVTYDGRRYDVDRDATTGDLTTPTNGGEDERWVSSAKRMMHSATTALNNYTKRSAGSKHRNSFDDGPARKRSAA
jgi:hypothetical protein